MIRLLLQIVVVEDHVGLEEMGEELCPGEGKRVFGSVLNSKASGSEATSEADRP